MANILPFVKVRGDRTASPKSSKATGPSIIAEMENARDRMLKIAEQLEALQELHCKS